jgi:predicted alpha/beta superfamily hydrolase
MKIQIYLVLFFTFVILTAGAQVVFVVDSLPAYTPPEDTLFIAGDFQGWNPGDPEYALEKNEDGKWVGTGEGIPIGWTIEFKFTRGDWGRVEKGPNGEEIPNRVYTYNGPDTLSIIIYNWADFGGGGTSTAAENVHIIDEEFYMPQLDRYRRVWIYLPPDYEETENHYPVIYMHDGQNLFDVITSFLGEWEVDETLNDLYDEGYFVPIVVGIDNGSQHRTDEYTPWINPEYGGGQGSLYMEFIVETLKPYIDENYRTLPGRESTGLWGSSLGGLISEYGLLKYQEVFSKGGIYSPSYWWSDSVWTFTADMGIQHEIKIWQMTGSLEGGSMVPQTWDMDELLTNMGLDEEHLSTTIVEGGEHNEQLWREDFEEAYLWLFHSFANDVREYRKKENLVVYPNPANEEIRIPDTMEGIEQIRIVDLTGRMVFESRRKNTNPIELKGLVPGVYFIEIQTKKKVYQGKFLKE